MSAPAGPSAPALDRAGPAAAPGSPARRVRTPLLVGAGVAALTVALRFRDPHQQGTWGVCPYLATTGLSCPGCGALRAVNDLAHGDVAGALSSNLLFTLLVPVLVVVWGRWLVRSWRGEPARPSSSRAARVVLVAAAVVVTVAFTVLRNTPQGAWLAP